MAKPVKSRAAKGLVGVIAIATALVAPWEGKRNSPYIDAVGVETVCYGETRVEMRDYTDAQCEAMLAKGLREFADGVATASPGIEVYPYMHAAHTSFAYNIGLRAYRKSSVRRLFVEGRFRAACEYMHQYKYGGRRVLIGLVRRRAGSRERVGEVEVCKIDAVRAELETGAR